MPNCRPLRFDSYTSVEKLAQGLRCLPQTFVISELQLKLHRIPKKKRQGAFREVWEIKSLPFKELLRTFNLEYCRFIRAKISDFPLPCVHGFIDNRSIVTNAKPHAGKSILLKCDIKNFFGSIRIEQLNEHFNRMNISPVVSNVLSSMLTLQGTLPQGFCTSPLMSNLVFMDLDHKLLYLASKYNCTYTRYADDITFSSNQILPSYGEICDILSESCFELDEQKF